MMDMIFRREQVQLADKLAAISQVIANGYISLT